MLVEQGIDIHAHILPETDDGAKTWEEAVEMMKAISHQGFSRVIATPHFAFSQNPDILRQKAERLNQEARSLSLDIRVSLGQEILYFEDIVSYLAEEKALPLAGSRYVLIEFMPEVPYSKMEKGVRDMVNSGYLPVIAHGERYGCLWEKGKLDDIIHSGAYIQMNYRSLSGGWMDKRARWCRKQVLEGRVHFLGTDMHNMKTRPPETKEASEWIRKHGGEELLERLTKINPQCILKDRLLEI